MDEILTGLLIEKSEPHLAEDSDNNMGDEAFCSLPDIIDWDYEFRLVAF